MKRNTADRVFQQPVRPEIERLAATLEGTWFAGRTSHGFPSPPEHHRAEPRPGSGPPKKNLCMFPPLRYNST